MTIFRRISMSKLPIIILSVVFHASFTSGTTIVIFVTPDGIVIATDSKAVNKDTAFTPQSETTIQKFVIVHDKIVVSTTGLTELSGQAPYRFGTWMDALQSKLSADASVEDVVWAIKEQSKVQFAPVQDAVQEGYLTKDRPDETCQDFLTYLVAGYQESTATLWEVQYYIDWNTQTLIGPKRTKILPPDQSTSTNNVFTATYGVQEVIHQFQNSQSYAYKQLKARAPKAFADYFDHKHLYLEDSVSIARVLVQIEEEMNPSDVGGEVRIVQIPTNGKAEEVKGRIVPKVRKPRKPI
jgi:hypothetical protein